MYVNINAPYRGQPLLYIAHNKFEYNDGGTSLYITGGYNSFNT